MSSSAPRKSHPPAAGFAHWRLLSCVVAFGAMLMLARVSWPSLTRSDSEKQLAALVEAVGDRRLAEGRLTGGFRVGRMQAVPAGDDARTHSDPGIALAVGRLDATARAHPNAENLRAAAVARLVQGQDDESVRALEHVVSLWRDDAMAHSDLSVAYLTRARAHDRPEDVIRALASAERAVQRAPTAPEPAFNRALALTGLNLQHEAARAWRAYLTLDGSSAWSEEARRQLAAIERQAAPVSWPDERAGILRAALQRDTAAIERLVASRAQQLRELVEDDLLPTWGREVLAHVPSSRDVLTQAETITRVLQTSTGDALLADAVGVMTAADANGRTAAREQIARGLAAYGEGRRLYEQNQVSAAEAPFKTAKAELRAAGSPMWLWCELHLGIVEYYRGHLEPSLAISRGVRAAAGTRPYRGLLARAHWMVALNHQLSAQYSSQIGEYRLALAALDAREHVNAAAIHNLLADAYQFLGDSRQVWAHTLHSLRSLGPLTPPRRLHNQLAGAASRATRWDMPEVALACANEARHHALRWGAPEAILEAERYRARALHALGRSAEAVAAAREARTHLTTVPERLFRERLTAELDQTEAEVLAAIDPARGLVAARSALSYFERQSLVLRLPRLRLAEGRARRSLGDLPGAIESFDLAARRFEAERAAVPADDATRISHFDELWQVYRELLEAHLAHGATNQALLAIAERAKARSLAERDTRLVDQDWVRALQANLPPRSAVVYYAQSDDRTLAWVLTSTAVRMHRLSVGQRAVGRDIDVLTDALIGGVSRAVWTPHAARLYDAVIEPLGLAGAGVDAITIIPDGSLNRLPFSALWNSRARTFLANEYVLSFAPSAGFLASSLNRPARERGTSRLLAVAIDQASREDRLPVLPAVSRETAHIARVFPRSRVLTGPAATLDALREALPRSDVLHIAGHVVANLEYPQLSRFFLFDRDGQVVSVFARDLPTLSLGHVGLVVLASCRGADGPLSRSEGVVSLARAFLLQGVPSVLVARWDVEDESTNRFMERFYSHLGRSVSPSIAFARAVRESQSLEPSNDTWTGWLLIGAAESETVQE